MQQLLLWGERAGGSSRCHRWREDRAEACGPHLLEATRGVLGSCRLRCRSDAQSPCPAHSSSSSSSTPRLPYGSHDSGPPFAKPLFGPNAVFAVAAEESVNRHQR